MPFRPGASLPGRGAAVGEPRAGSLGDVAPGITLAIPLRGPGARGVRGLAIVLTSLCDAEALLGFELRHRRRPGARDGGHGDGGDDGRSEDQACLHRIILLSTWGRRLSVRAWAPLRNSSRPWPRGVEDRRSVPLRAAPRVRFGSLE